MITVPHSFAEIDNCEIWAWSHSAVQVFESSCKGKVYVHHNYIHHNTFYSCVNIPIVVRGIPNAQGSFHHNWFVNLNMVKQYHKCMQIFKNAYGTNKKIMDSEKPKHIW